MRRIFRKRVVEAPPQEGIWQVPARFNYTRDVVERFAADPLRPALTYVDHNGVIDRRTFVELAREANRWAALLRSRGLGSGDRVLVFTGRTPTWVTLMLGALKAGIVVVPCSEGTSAGDLAWRAEDSGARLIVCDRDRASVVALMDVPLDVVIVEDAVAELRKTAIVQPTHDTAAGDIAAILYTADALGLRGAAHTHASTWAQRVPAEHWLEARPGDLVWCKAGPDGAESIWTLLFGPWACGAEIVVHETDFATEEELDLLQRLGVTILCQTPADYRQIAETTTGPLRPGRLRHAVSLGAALDPDAADAFQDAFGIAVWDGFGQIENTILVAHLRDSAVKPGSIGIATPGHTIAVLDGDGSELPPGTEGELALDGRPPSLFVGYWNAPEMTAAVFRDSWYLTGERAVIDEDGHVWLAERAGAAIADDVTATPEPELLEDYARATNGAIPHPEPDTVEELVAVGAGAAAEIADERSEAEQRRASEAARRHEELAAAAAAAEQAAAARREAAEEQARLEAEEREEARLRREVAAIAAAEAARIEQERVELEAAEREEARRREEEATAAAAAAEAARFEQERLEREAAEQEAAAQAEARRREEEAAAAAAALAAAEAARAEEEREQREREEREAAAQEEARRREEEAAVIAAAQAAAVAQERTEPDPDELDPREQAHLREELAAAAAAAERTAAEAAARAEKARREAEERGEADAEAAEQEREAAAAALAAEEARRAAEEHLLLRTSPGVEPPAEEPATAPDAPDAPAAPEAPEPLTGRAARKAAAEQRKQESRQRKAAERERKEAEKAAAEQRKRDEAEQRAAAAQQEKEAELQRQEEARRLEEEARVRAEAEKAAAEQRKREEAKQQAAEAERALEAERLRQEEAQRREVEEWQRAEAEKAAAEQRRRQEDAQRAAAAERIKASELRQQEVEIRQRQADLRLKEEEKQRRAAEEAAAARAKEEADERLEALQRLEAEQRAEREALSKVQPETVQHAPEPAAAAAGPEVAEKPRRHVRLRKAKEPVEELDEFEEVRQEEPDGGPNAALISRLRAYGRKDEPDDPNGSGGG